MYILNKEHIYSLCAINGACVQVQHSKERALLTSKSLYLTLQAQRHLAKAVLPENIPILCFFFFLLFNQQRCSHETTLQAKPVWLGNFDHSVKAEAS